MNGARHGVVSRRVLCGLAALFTLFWAGPRIFAGALILAFGVRLAYVLVRRRARLPLLSAWIFVIALGLLVVSWAGRHGRVVERSSAAAVRQGVVARKSDATPRDRAWASSSTGGIRTRRRRIARWASRSRCSGSS